jgi:hypothetical protein
MQSPVARPPKASDGFLLKACAQGMHFREATITS